jgi:hypothetical protein
MIRETVYIMTVLMKSNAESISDASTEREDEVSVTIILATSNNTFAVKLMRIAKFTIPDPTSALGRRLSTWGSRADSSSKETLLEEG